MERTVYEAKGANNTFIFKGLRPSHLSSAWERIDNYRKTRPLNRLRPNYNRNEESDDKIKRAFWGVD